MTIATDPASKARPPSTKAERTRASILASARVVFNRDGLALSRVSDIVRHAEVAHGTFYTYFTSKQDAFAHVVVELFEDIRAAIHSLPDVKKQSPYDAIRQENLAYMTVLKENARIVGLLLAHTVANEDDLTARHRDESRYFMDRAEQSIRIFQAQGIAHTDIDPSCVSKALGCMIEQFCVQWVTQDWDFDIETAADQITNLWVRSIGIEVPTSH